MNVKTLRYLCSRAKQMVRDIYLCSRVKQLVITGIGKTSYNKLFQFNDLVSFLLFFLEFSKHPNSQEMLQIIFINITPCY